MRFTNPLALLLLLTLPALAVLGRPSRGPGRRREMASLVLRFLLVLCLILALTGLETVRPVDDLAVVFLMDVSDSVPPEAQAAGLEYMRRAVEEMGLDDRWALVVFGKEALVERSMTSSPTMSTPTSVLDTSQTDLSAAIRLALALFPPDAAPRLVILSDGAVTTGNALKTSRLAVATGVELLGRSFEQEPRPEVLVSQLEVPSQIRQGERFDLETTVVANTATEAELRVFSDGELLFRGTYELTRGSQSFRIPLTAQEPGFTRYVVQISPQIDTAYQNNEMTTFAQVLGPPSVLLIAPPEGEKMGLSGKTRPDEVSALADVMESAGFLTEVRPPHDLPSSLPTLATFNAVVLVDVPARQLTQAQMRSLQAYVRDVGGGLVAVGGPTSYGVGGYFRTPLEATLPVDMQIKDELRRPALAMVFIIDRSGSMSETSGGVTKLELAKEATSRSVELMFPGDRVGVIAFDETASWVVELSELDNPMAVTNVIGTLAPGGGTDILAGLEAMARKLPGDPAMVKHVILLTDGGADPTGIPELVTRLHNDHGITLTTVGVGSDAAPYLANLAALGGGRYHFTADPGSIPSIFTEETALVTRAYIVEEPFHPEQRNPSPILDGITEVPPLYGRVTTSAKDVARTILVAPNGDPLLATWQYGLGKSAAFTSDATGRWARDWVPWSGFERFWSQAVRFTVGQTSPVPFHAEVEPEGDQARIVVEARKGNGAFLNGARLEAHIVGPDEETQTLQVPQVAPGRYAAKFQPSVQGVYLLRITGEGTAGEIGEALGTTVGWALSYSPEYRQTAFDPEALPRLVLASGGQTAPDDPAEVFARPGLTKFATRPIWPWSLTLAALLLPIDIAIRRLVITRADLKHAWLALRRRLPHVEHIRSSPPVRSRQVEALFQAKRRAVEARQPSDLEALSEGLPPPEAERELSLAPEEVGQPRAEQGEPQEGGSTAAHLLARKREKRGKRSS